MTGLDRFYFPLSLMFSSYLNAVVGYSSLHLKSMKMKKLRLSQLAFLGVKGQVRWEWAVQRIQPWEIGD